MRLPLQGSSVPLESAENKPLTMSANERHLIEEVIRALRRIRFGSVVLTIHDGRVVEIHKTEKIRKAG